MKSRPRFSFCILHFSFCIFSMCLLLSRCGPPPNPMPGGGREPESEGTLSFRFLLSFGTFGSGPGRFIDPHGISVDRLGSVYVADTGNDRIQKFDEDGHFLDEIGGFGWDADQFNRPTDVYVRDGLEIYVVDAGNRRIQRFDSRLTLLESITHYQEEEFGELMSLAVSPTGDLYLTDLHRDEVIRLSSFTGEARLFGGSEIGGGGWFRPWGVAVEGERTVTVSEPENGRIVRFDPFGNLLSVWGQGGTDREPALHKPLGMTIDRQGRLFVADAGAHQVVVFGQRGNVLGRLGAKGEGWGAFREPRDVALGPGERLYVLDSGNARVQKFRIARE
ncbi:MAG: NHL repeat-containing protein [Candidatus Latescibacterota bacterium]